MSNNFIQAVKNALDAFADTLNTKEPVCQTPVSPTTDNTDKDIPADATIQGQVPVTDEDQSKDSSSATVSTVPVVEPEPSSVDMEAKPADTCPTDTQDDVKQVQEDKPQLDLDNPEIRLKTALKIESGGYVLG